MQVSTFANAVWAPLLGPDTDVDNIEWGDGTHEPHGVAVDGEGNIIFADAESHRICKISPDGNVSTLAGSGSEDWGDGQGTLAHFNDPCGVAVDGNDNMIVADRHNHRIRKIRPDGNVSTLAGSGSADSGDGQGTQAHFNCPCGVAVDGNDNIIVADTFNHRIRKVSPDGNVSTLAGSGSADWGDGQGTQAHFNTPCGVAVDGNDNIIVADEENHRIRKISPDGNVSTLAGSGSEDWGDGQGTQTHFNDPCGVAVDGNDNIVADRLHHRIRKISPDGNVSTLAGSGSADSGDGQGTQAHFYCPYGVAVDG